MLKHVNQPNERQNTFIIDNELVLDQNKFLLVQLWYHILIHHELEVNMSRHFHWYSHLDIEHFENHFVCHSKPKEIFRTSSGNVLL